MKQPLKTLVKRDPGLVETFILPVETVKEEYEPGPMERRDILRQVAAEARRSLPPAVVKRPRKTVLVNFKISEGLAIALAKRSQDIGITQKQIITRALAKLGLPADAQDLADGSVRRRGDQP